MNKRANWRVSHNRVHPRAEAVQFGQPAPSLLMTDRCRASFIGAGVGVRLRAAGHALPTSVGSAVACVFSSVRRALSRLTETPHEAAQRRAAEWLPVLLLAESRGLHASNVRDLQPTQVSPAIGGKAHNLGGRS